MDKTTQVVSSREKIFAKLFTCTFLKKNLESCLSKNTDSTYFGQLLRSLDEIDIVIATKAKERPLAEINKIDLAILRLIVFEWRKKKTAPKILINEAVELARSFGTDSSYRFVNGVLGKIMLGEE